MKIVTSGARYIDIDAYAGIIAYAELLNLLGDEAKAVSLAALNESITPTIRAWQVPFEAAYQPNATDGFVLIDVSDPKQFDTFVEPSRVVEIIDHHPEAKEYWQNNHQGTTVQIERIGAACTLVYERWVQAAMLDRMSETTAKLLTAGILDNTLNFLADISTERDKQAYQDLARRGKLTDDWPAQYFGECQQTIMQDVATALQNDTKSMLFSVAEQPIAIGQLVIWDASQALQQIELMRTTMRQQSAEWFINIVSINEGKSYLVASDASMAAFLQALLDVAFDGLIGTAPRLWLRKEIMQADLEKNKE